MASFSTTVTKSKTAPTSTGFVADTIDASGTTGDRSQDNDFLLRSSAYTSGATTLHELHVYDLYKSNLVYLDQDSTEAFTDISISNFTFKKHDYYYVTYLNGTDFDYQVLDSTGHVLVGETTIGSSTDISSIVYDGKGDLIAQYGAAKFATISFQGNEAPVAVADKATSGWDSDVKVDVQANDTDADSDTLSISSATVASGDATVKISQGQLLVHYTGDALALDQTADVKINYTLSDGSSTDTGKLTVTFNDGYSRFNGTDADNTIYGTSGRDIIDAKDSTHSVRDASTHTDLVSAGAGADIIYGGGGNNWVYAGAGADTIYGNNDNGYDWLCGDDGDDTIYGFDGTSQLQGADGDDVIVGGNDSDFISGGAGKDVIAGGGGDDLITGSNQTEGPAVSNNDDMDIIFGGGGNDVIYGREGADLLSGNSGADTIVGGQGYDVIMGGLGGDTMWGGAGNDQFYFFKSSGKDTIKDFSRTGVMGEDVLYLDSDLINSADHHKPTVTYDTKNDFALVDLGGGDTIELDGVHKGDLTGDWYKIANYKYLNFDAFFG